MYGSIFRNRYILLVFVPKIHFTHGDLELIFAFGARLDVGVALHEWLQQEFINLISLLKRQVLDILIVFNGTVAKTALNVLTFLNSVEDMFAKTFLVGKVEALCGCKHRFALIILDFLSTVAAPLKLLLSLLNLL